MNFNTAVEAAVAVTLEVGVAVAAAALTFFLNPA